MKYNCKKDDFFYHINAILNDGSKFYCSCTKDKMIEFIRKHRRSAKTKFKDDTDLIKAYLAVQDRVYERPKPIPAGPKIQTDGKFMFLYLQNDLWKAIEKNVPKDKWSRFIEDAIEKILRQEGYYIKRKKE